MQRLGSHQLRLRGSVFESSSVTLQALQPGRPGHHPAAAAGKRILRVSILDW